MMPEGIQRIMAAEGEAGCLLLTLLHVGELEDPTTPADPIAAYQHDLWARLIEPSCRVDDIAAVLNQATGEKWLVLKAGDGLDDNGVPYSLPFDYVLQPGEHEVGEWKWKVSPVQTKIHFAYRGPRPSWDPYGGAATIANGQLVARYILRKLTGVTT